MPVVCVVHRSAKFTHDGGPESGVHRMSCSTSTSWWVDKVLELRSNAKPTQPVSSICLMNYRSFDAAVTALCQFPQADLSGVRYQRGFAMKHVDEAILAAGVGRKMLRNVNVHTSRSFAPGDSRALPGASHCDLLIVDTTPPARISDNGTEDIRNSDAQLSPEQRRRRLEVRALRRGDFAQSLLLGLGPALEAASKASRGSSVLMHGPTCQPKAIYQSADASYKPVTCWSQFFMEHATSGSLTDAECRAVDLNSSTAISTSQTMCIATVNPVSVCSSRTPLLSPSSAGRLRATKARVRFSTGIEPADWLLTRSARYFIAVPCYAEPDGVQSGTSPSTTDPHVCLFFKDAAYETWVAGLSSSDGLHFHGPPRLLMPSLLRITEQELRAGGQWVGYTRLASPTHNLAIDTEADGSYLVVGGRFHAHRPVGNGNTGIWLTRVARRAASHAPGEAGLLLAWQGTHTGRLHDAALSNGTALSSGITWRRLPQRQQPTLGESLHLAMRPRLLFTGRDKGCIERRSKVVAPWILDGACEFDGRLSLVRHRGRGRGGVGGKRAATSSSSKGSTDTGNVRGRLLLYARANMASHGQRYVQVTVSDDDGVTWSRFRPIQFDRLDAPEADLYFFNVARNPVHNDTLLAIFPLVHHLQACIAMSASRDGRHWSAPEPLTSCLIAGERAMSHPAAGLIDRGAYVDLYVHEGVPGISVDARSPQILKKFWERPQREAKLSRYSISRESLREWTQEALSSLDEARGASRRSNQYRQ